MFDGGFAPDVIDALSTGTYQVTRRAAATFVDGLARPGLKGSLTIEASVQPYTGKELLRLPEGRRTEETQVIFTVTELLTGGEGSKNEADLIAIDGKLWEVQLVDAWNGSYYRAFAQRLAE